MKARQGHRITARHVLVIDQAMALVRGIADPGEALNMRSIREDVRPFLEHPRKAELLTRGNLLGLKFLGI